MEGRGRGGNQSIERRGLWKSRIANHIEVSTAYNNALNCWTPETLARGMVTFCGKSS